MRVLACVGALVIMAGGVGCAVPMTTTSSPPTGTAVVVQNKSVVDVEVFIWDGGNRGTRLGPVAAGDTASFKVPETITSVAGPYYLEARTVQGSGYPAQSESFALRTGYRITWAIPPVDAVGAAPEDPPTDTASKQPGQD